MAHIALKLDRPTRNPLGRIGTAIRSALAAVAARQRQDWFREPAGLQYPVTQRARRLMRAGHFDGC